VPQCFRVSVSRRAWEGKLYHSEEGGEGRRQDALAFRHDGRRAISKARWMMGDGRPGVDAGGLVVEVVDVEDLAMLLPGRELGWE
jgi:hypothetical protein